MNDTLATLLTAAALFVALAPLGWLGDRISKRRRDQGRR